MFVKTRHLIICSHPARYAHTIYCVDKCLFKPEPIQIFHLWYNIVHCVSLCTIAKTKEKISSLESELAALKSRIAAYALAEVERNQGNDGRFSQCMSLCLLWAWCNWGIEISPCVFTKPHSSLCAVNTMWIIIVSKITKRLVYKFSWCSMFCDLGMGMGVLNGCVSHLDTLQVYRLIQFVPVGCMCPQTGQRLNHVLWFRLPSLYLNHDLMLFEVILHIYNCNHYYSYCHNCS